MFILNWKKSILALLLMSCVAIVYSPVIKAPFVWDDEEMVMANPLIQNLENIPSIFASGPFMEKWDSSTFYRPIQTVSYCLDYAIWGLNPSGYHVTSIAIHALSTALVFYLLLTLGAPVGIALLVAAIWGVHPLNIESVTYISGRGDALFMLFGLGALLLWIKGLTNKWWLPLSILLWVLAILSKENAIPIPFILSWYLWIHRDDYSANTRTLNWSLAGGLTVAYILFRFKFLGGQASALSWIAEATLWERIMTVPYILFTYLRLWFVPFPLHMEYHYVAESLKNAYIWVGLPILGAITFILKRLVTKKEFAFWGGWIFLGLLPVYNVILPLASTVREHWFYLSGIGMAMLCILAVKKWIHSMPEHLQKTVQNSLIIGILLIASLLTTLRNQDWLNPKTLYAHDLKYESRSFLLHNNLGVEYYRAQDWTNAKESFLNAIYATPGGSGYGVAHNNYGVILENEGRINEAIVEFQTSIQLSKYSLAYGNFGRILLRNQKPDIAIKVLEEGITNNPYATQLWIYLGFSYMETQQVQKAFTTFKKAQALGANNPQVDNAIKILAAQGYR